MKKLLALFFVLDLIFVGVVLKLNSEKRRNIASTDEATSELTDGQQQKLQLIQSFKFVKSGADARLSTNMLQSLCASYKYVLVKFKAMDMAVSGQAPTVINSFSCAQVSSDTSQDFLSTDTSVFEQLKIQKKIGQLSSVALFRDEDLPQSWKFFELEVIGDDPAQDHFTISEAELNTYIGHENLIFNLSTSEK
jgi:hypothetical protein